MFIKKPKAGNSRKIISSNEENDNKKKAIVGISPLSKAIKKVKNDHNKSLNTHSSIKNNAIAPKVQSALNKNFYKQVSNRDYKERMLDKYLSDNLKQNEDKVDKYNITYKNHLNKLKNLYSVPKEIDVDLIPNTSEFDEKAIWARGMVEVPIGTEDKINLMQQIESSKRLMLHQNALEQAIQKAQNN